jgi:hypothetical protein
MQYSRKIAVNTGEKQRKHRRNGPGFLSRFPFFLVKPIDPIQVKTGTLQFESW